MPYQIRRTKILHPKGYNWPKTEGYQKLIKLGREPSTAKSSQELITYLCCSFYSQNPLMSIWYFAYILLSDTLLWISRLGGGSNLISLASISCEASDCTQISPAQYWNEVGGRALGKKDKLVQIKKRRKNERRQETCRRNDSCLVPFVLVD